MARRTLETLIRLGRFEVDEKRRDLGRLLDREAEMKETIRRLDEQLREEQSVAATMRDQLPGQSYGAFAAAVKQRKAAQLDKLAALYPEIEQARAALADAFGTLKKYEIAAANRAEAEAAEESRQETQELDELGLSAHRRRD